MNSDTATTGITLHFIRRVTTRQAWQNRSDLVGYFQAPILVVYLALVWAVLAALAHRDMSRPMSTRMSGRSVTTLPVLSAAILCTSGYTFRAFASLRFNPTMELGM